MFMTFLVMIMIQKHRMRHWPVSNNLNWAVIRRQLLRANLVRLVVKQRTIHTGNGFNVRRYGSQIVRYHYYGHPLVELLE